MNRVLIDLDVLADSSWRADMLQAPGSVDWDAYHVAGFEDPCDLRAAMVANGLHRVGCDLVVMTERPHRYFQLVISWLTNHSILGGTVVMRRDDDFRNATEVKSEIVLAEHEKSPIMFALVGDERLADACRALGVYVVQVSSS